MEPTTAGRIAASPLVTIDRAEPVHQAAMLMSAHEYMSGVPSVVW